MKLAVASALFFVIASVAGTGYFVVRGAGHAAGVALAWLEPVVRTSLPPALDPAAIEARLGAALALVREGRIDAAALRDTVLWLPGALLDGRLDDAEVERLADELDRVIAAPARAES